jgi:dimethylamine monooxygenase subunit A
MVRASTLTSAQLHEYAPDESLYHRAASTEWLDELDFRTGPPYHHMGTHALDLDRWFVIDEAREMELALRNRLLTEQRDIVFDCLATADDAASEVLELVTDWLQRRGIDTTTYDDHPLAAASRLVQDDLCLMVRHDDDWYLDAGALCFPTVWQLADKLGKPTGEVHGPVPHYASELAPRVDRFFDRLRAESPVWRRNLSVKPFTLLFLPTSKADQPVGHLTTAPDGSPFWLRSERQTLRRLPRTGAILFAIRVQLTPAAVLLNRPDRARDMAAMFRSWDDGLNGYKIGANDLKENFLPWLDSVAATA